MKDLYHSAERKFPEVAIERVHWPLDELDHPAKGSAHQKQLTEVRMVSEGATGESNHLGTDWGTCVALFESCGFQNNAISHPKVIFSPWVFSENEEFFNYITMLVLEYPGHFDVQKNAPQLAAFERAEYMSTDLESGDEVFRIIIPVKRDWGNMLWHGRLKQLRDVIQALADGDGSHPTSIGDILDRGRKFLACASNEDKRITVHFGNLLTVPYLAKLQKARSKR